MSAKVLACSSDMPTGSVEVARLDGATCPHRPPAGAEDVGPRVSRQDCMCNLVAFRNENRDHWSCTGDPLRHRPTSPVPNIRPHHLERFLRHPACPLCCAAAIAGIAFLLVSARALPLLGGILATLAIGGVGPWIAVRSATAVIAWDRRRCRVADTLTATITWRSILPWWRPHVSLSWRDADRKSVV